MKFKTPHQTVVKGKKYRAFSNLKRKHEKKIKKAARENENIRNRVES